MRLKSTCELELPFARADEDILRLHVSAADLTHAAASMKSPVHDAPLVAVLDAAQDLSGEALREYNHDLCSESE